MPKLTEREQIRYDYELDVLRELFGTHTKAATKRAAVRYLHDQLLAQRIAGTSCTMQADPIEPRKAA